MTVMSAHDAWQILGIPPGSPPEAVKAAYRDRAREVHPDVPGGSRDAWDELESAYTLLVAAGLTDADQWVPEPRPAERAVRRWRAVKRPWRLLTALGLGAVIVGPSTWGLYTATRPYEVPWQMIVWPMVYVFGWFVWWAQLEVRRPTIRPRRYYFAHLKAPSDPQQRHEFGQALSDWDAGEGSPPGKRGGKSSSRRSGSP